ncbi:membrane protein FAM174B [Heterodontus francisci]|uniref:membrane protein FAM174B n=1 Tax=Heterodontus francisci TaxID=7792 RepID=UPI00355BF0D4
MCGWQLCAALLLLAVLSSLPVSGTNIRSPPNSDHLNQTGSPTAPSNATATAFDSVASILRHFSTLKNLVLAACAGSFLIIVCLLARVIRSGKKTKKTRKYDIITTPAEKVEMTPLNEDDDDDEDATVFDVKYSR